MKFGRSCRKDQSSSSVSYLSAAGTCLKFEKGFCTKVWCSSMGFGGRWSLSTAQVEFVLLSFPNITKMWVVQLSHNVPPMSLKISPDLDSSFCLPLGIWISTPVGGGLGISEYLFKESMWIRKWSSSLTSFTSEIKLFAILWETKSWSDGLLFSTSSIWAFSLGSQGRQFGSRPQKQISGLTYWCPVQTQP